VIRAGSIPTQTLSQQDLELIDAYWRAANYLSVGEISPSGPAYE
jgi:phosphoketolase